MKVSHEGQYPSLKTLCREVLGTKEGEFQKGEHCPVSARRSRGGSKLIIQVEDARATMKIFLKVREEYEQALMRGEEVVAGIPAYVYFSVVLFSSLSNFSPYFRSHS